MRFLGFLFVLCAAAGLGAFLYAIFGFYDVAATDPHPPPVEWVLSTVFDASVEHHAADEQVPPLDDTEMFQDGFRHYHAMCETCHGGPGVKPSPIGKGLYPSPPDLRESGEEMSAAELFWIVKYGAKDTGMPAFGKTHEDHELWEIVAFVKRLPRMSAADYRELGEKLGVKPATPGEAGPKGAAAPAAGAAPGAAGGGSPGGANAD